MERLEGAEGGDEDVADDDLGGLDECSSARFHILESLERVKGNNLQGDMTTDLNDHHCGEYSQQGDQRSNQPFVESIKHSVGELEGIVDRGDVDGGDGGVRADRGTVRHLSPLTEYLFVVRTVAQGVESNGPHHQGAQAGPEQHHAQPRLSALPAHQDNL